MPIKLPTNSTTDRSDWDIAIGDASAELQKLDVRRSQLVRAIRIFRANKRDGIAWPRESRQEKAR